MQSVLVWKDTIPERSNESCSVLDLAFRPDGQQLIAAVGSRVLLYDALDGTLLQSLKSHKAAVYAVDYAHDGKRFASGGADNIVIIWTEKAEGILKYTHNDSIQKLAYNPQSQSLASFTATDFGLWAPEQKSVSKHKVISKILSACWTRDGQHLAIGMLNGMISIRDTGGLEKQSFQRPGPIWTLSWNTSAQDDLDVLAVGCWDQTLSFYAMNGALQGRARNLGFNPTSFTYLNKGRYLLIAGSNRKVGIYTKDGIFLASVNEENDWIWSIRSRPKTNSIVVGTESGCICMYSLAFGTVHGIYQERYAYRENMTDVIVQHLMTEQKVRIKTRDLVKKLSVYRDRLAVQLSDRIIIYELANSNVSNAELDASAYSLDMHYRVKERIPFHFPCSSLVVTTEHFILCQKQKLQQYNFAGEKEREWVLESLIRYIRVTGGARGKEGLLLGLKDGSVWQIFLGNPFPILLIQQAQPISCLDISTNREKLAIVNDLEKCLVYDLKTKELLFEESDANSVAWNTEFEDMLCFAGKQQLKIKTDRYNVHSQRMQGFVVGFTGSKVFCLNAHSVQTTDIPQSAALYRYVEQSELRKAFHVACLGVTEADWRMLAWEALKQMSFEIARKAFTRIRDVRYLELVHSLEQMKKQFVTDAQGDHELERCKKGNLMLQGEILAYQSRFQQAAKVFQDANEPQRAIQLFSEMRMWEDAKKFAGQGKLGDIKDLAEKQANWAEELQDWRAAAELYVASGNLMRAVEIMGERGWFDDMLELIQQRDPSVDAKLLAACAMYFIKAEKYTHARDLYLRIGDIDALLSMHIQLGEWEEAVRLTQKHRDRVKNLGDVYVPYAQWLIGEDRFEDALEAYSTADRPDHCIQLLHQLIENTVDERRYRDASYYHWRLCEQKLSCVKASSSDAMEAAERKILQSALEHERLSKVYHAYAMIFSFTDEPFTNVIPEWLFHSALFLLNTMNKQSRVLPGISLANIYFTLGHFAVQLEAYKLARQVFDRLLQMRVRNEWTQDIELTSMTLEIKPFSDKDELLPVDYRSSTKNSLLNPNGTGDTSIHSGHPMIRSFASFETLPLVEFQPMAGIEDEYAERLIAEHPEGLGSSRSMDDEWQQVDHGDDQQTLRMHQESDPATTELFEVALQKQAKFVSGFGHRSAILEYRVLQLDEKTLQSLSPSEVFIVKYPCKALRNRYFKNMIPEIKVYLSPHCRRFFHEEEYELEYLKSGVCPCCRLPDSEAAMT